MDEVEEAGEVFPKARRLLTRRDFGRVQRKGQRHVTGALVCLAAPSDTPWSRLGVTVSRKVGKAHVRNKVKRRLREVFRRNASVLPRGWDFVWIARRSAAEVTFAQLAEEALRGSQRAASRHRSSDGSRRRRKRRNRPS